MDAPFETKEIRDNDLDKINATFSFALKASRYYEGQIIEKENFDEVTLEETITLAGNYLCSRLAVGLHLTDADTIPWDENDARRIAASNVDPIGRRERGRIESAIREAQEGKYSQMKAVLKKEAVSVKSDIAIKIRTEEDVVLADAILNLVKVLPDQSDVHFKLPTPAHLDPRFNPNASPSS